MSIDWKDVIYKVMVEVLNEIKGEAKEFIQTTVVPALTDAKNDFIIKLKEEADAGTWKDKARNGIIILAVNATSSFCKKIVDLLFK